jgi:hypothetical protein
MLQHILIMFLFTLFVGGIQFIVKARKNKQASQQHSAEEEQPIKKAV